jgi:hypothetical protein
MRFKAFGFIASIAILLLSACGTSPGPSETPEVIMTCTVEDCGVTLSIALTGSVPEDYVLEASTPNGEKMSVHCVGAKGVYAEDHFERRSYPMCKYMGVDFVRFSPDEVTITINWSDKKASQVFKPLYRVEWPNGPRCEPECRIGQISFQLELY